MSQVSSRSASRRKKLRRAALQAFLITMSVIWVLPIAWAIYTSFRPYDQTATYGYVSIAGTYNLDNYVNSFNQGQLPMYFMNTVIILVPAVILVLFLSSMMAFTVSRYSWRFNLILLMVFSGANLLPPQVIITPLFRMYLAIPMFAPLSDNGILYDQYIGITLINVAFQTGFCTFVLSELHEDDPEVAHRGRRASTAQSVCPTSTSRSSCR
jgi:multiple sugar transport system permease protein